MDNQSEIINLLKKLNANVECICEYLKRDEDDDDFYIDPIMDRNLQREEDYYDGFCDGKEEGEKSGEKQGALKNLKKMVKSFYKNGVSLDLISASSGLSIKEINKIVREKN